MNKNSNKSDIAIDFQKIEFGYIDTVPIIKDVSFQIKKSKYVCLIGHNGSGKSTISKLLMGLIKPWSGTVKIYNKILTAATLKEILNTMGLIFQNPDNQFIGLTTEDDIAFGLENRKVEPKVIGEIICDIADIMEIKDLLQKNASELSGGQKQKVAISSILAINPDVIIFDESTSMLDSWTKEEIKTLMKTLSHVHKKTIISITHDMEETLYCDEVIVLKNGKIIAHTSPVELFKNSSLVINAKLDLPFNIALLEELNKQNHTIEYTHDLDKIISSILKK